MVSATTLPQQLVQQAGQLPAGAIAVREKRLGIWQALTWREYLDRVRALAGGLDAIGLGHGQSVILLGGNRPIFYAMQLAVQSLGGRAVPLHPDADEAEVAACAEATGAIGAFCLGLEQVDKVRAALARGTPIRWAVFEQGRGGAPIDDDRFLLVPALVDQGAARSGAAADWLEQRIALGQPDDVANVVFTAGTGGSPRGVRLTHRNLIAAAGALAGAEEIGPRDQVLAFLPTGWIADVEFALALPLATGCAVACPEEPETFQHDLREIGPTVLYATPQVWRDLAAATIARLDETGGLKRRVFRGALRASDRVAVQLRSGGAPDPAASRRWLDELFVFGPLRDHLGLSRIRHAYSGGPTSVPLLAFFRSIGVNLVCAYGLTEAAGLVAVQRAGEVRAGTVGRALTGTELRIGDGGEVLIRGDAVGAGYLAAKAGPLVDPDGWLHTGDAGDLAESGELRVIGHLTDRGALADGTPFAPALVEQELVASPYVRRAIAIGDGQREVTAAIWIDAETVGSWARRQNLVAADYAALTRLDPVGELLRGEVDRANERLPAALRVARLFLLPEEPIPGEGILTRGGTIRRAVFRERQAGVVAALAEGRATVPLDRGDGSPPDVEPARIWTVQSPKSKVQSRVGSS